MPETRAIQPGVYELDEDALEDAEDTDLIRDFEDIPPSQPSHVDLPSPSLDDEQALPLPSTPPSPAGFSGSTGHAPLLGELLTPPESQGTGTAKLRSSPPLLLDVTPLSLAVETVGGYCDVLVERNSKVPCQQARVFVTSVDHQRTVTVRVCQGDSRRFNQNTLLGEVVLEGLRDAKRGGVSVEVAFVLDPDGILGVRARDLGTGREAAATLRLVGLTESVEIESLARRQAQYSVR